MRHLILILAALLAARPGLADTIDPAQASAHIGQTVTIKGKVEGVHTARSGVTFLDMGGQYPNNEFTAVIFSADAARFPKVAALAGKTVEITGPIELYQGKPEIILKDAGQVKGE